MSKREGDFSLSVSCGLNFITAVPIHTHDESIRRTVVLVFKHFVHSV